MCRSLDNRPAADSRRRRILVVDDEPTLRLGFAYALSDHQTVVDTAGTGRQALEMIAAHGYDLIVLDLRMPDIDGFGVLERLREDGREVPVVLCTAALTPASALRAIQWRVVDFLLKPVRPEDLRSVIKFVLEPAAGVYPAAMQAARSGDFDGAIGHFAVAAPTDPRSGAWLTLLRIMRSTDPDKQEAADRELQHGGTSMLAYRADWQLPDIP